MSENRHILILLQSCFTNCFLVSCLQETTLYVDVDFGYEIDSEFNTTPLTINIENNTTGADYFEWTFEGGNPAVSSDKNPSSMTVWMFMCKFPQVILIRLLPR